MSYRGGHKGRRKPYRGEGYNVTPAVIRILNSNPDSDESFGYNNQNQAFETPEDKLKRSIISLGEVVC